MSRNLYIALPAYDGTTRVETTMALLQESQDLIEAGVTFSVKVNAGDSILPRARNMFLADFLRKKEFTDLLFLDHDICWPKGTIRRLLSHPVDFVAGVYPKRSDPVEFAVQYKTDSELLVADPDNGLLEVNGVPCGFLRLSRRCIEAMAQRYHGLLYEEPAVNGKAVALFDFQLVEGQYWGEDFVFCRRWREMGGKVWVDPDIKFQHVGFKRFEASLAEYLADRMTDAEREKVRQIRPVVRVPANGSAA